MRLSLVLCWLVFASYTLAENKPVYSIKCCTVSADETTWRQLVKISTDSDNPTKVTPVFKTHAAKVVDFAPKTVTVAARKPGFCFVTLNIENPGKIARLYTSLKESPSTTARSEYRYTIDLSVGEWQSYYDEGKWLADISTPPAESIEWKPAVVSDTVNEIGIKWLRTEFVVPGKFKGTMFSLAISAVDDNDKTFVNGQLIGETHGWNTPRRYEIPSDIIRWGEKNELLVAVENVNAGGGIYKGSIAISTGKDKNSPQALFTHETIKETNRQQPRRLGNPIPLRQLVVRDGVLEYEDGGEVALWGANIYPQSGPEFATLTKLGIDHYRAVDDDFDDFVAMGLDIIRIHVFDTEISDSHGNLVHNKHLDILDYIVSKCNENDIYLMLTPIAWWSSPNRRPDSFSSIIPKQAMSMCKIAWPIQENYFKQFFTHINPYTKRRLVDEPCLGLIEIINEPSYWSYTQMVKGSPGETFLPHDVSVKAIELTQKQWNGFLPDAKWQSPATFEAFRYQTVRDYIDTMINAIRSTGARQPIAWFRTWWGNGYEDIFQAAADSKCDAITIGAYPGGLARTPEADKRNLLQYTADKDLEACFKNKARLVYEFDDSASLKNIYMYPALARYFRNSGVQVACQFQYDTRSAAHINHDWPQHYLNLHHTPERIASFLIAAELFRNTDRGTSQTLTDDENIFAPAAVSYKSNAAIYCDKDTYMQARTTDWKPLNLPGSPKHIVSVGSCPYFDYSGTGLVAADITENQILLTIYPDVDRLQYATVSSVEKPLTKLVSRENVFKLKIPGWDQSTIEILNGDSWTPMRFDQDRATVVPGRYRIKRK